MEKLTTFVELLYPGSFYPEEEESFVTERNPEEIAAKYPRCFSFQFYDQVVKDVKVDGEKRTVRGPKRNVSPKYFPGASLFTAAELKKLNGDYSILISNMECNGWQHVVKCRTGNFQPFEKDCELI